MLPLHSDALCEKALRLYRVASSEEEGYRRRSLAKSDDTAQAKKVVQVVTSDVSFAVCFCKIGLIGNSLLPVNILRNFVSGIICEF